MDNKTNIYYYKSFKNDEILGIKTPKEIKDELVEIAKKLTKRYLY